MRIATNLVLGAALLAGTAATSTVPALAGDEVRTMCVTGVASNDVLNIREWPNARSSKIGAIAPHGCTTVVGVCDRWCNVQHGSVNGFAAARFLRVAGGGGIDTGHGPDSYCVRNVATNDSLNVRTAPGTRSARVNVLPFNACGITITGSCSGNWCPIAWGGVRGYVNTRFLGE